MEEQDDDMTASFCKWEDEAPLQTFLEESPLLYIPCSCTHDCGDIVPSAPSKSWCKSSEVHTPPGFPAHADAMIDAHAQHSAHKWCQNHIEAVRKSARDRKQILYQDYFEDEDVDEEKPHMTNRKRRRISEPTESCLLRSLGAREARNFWYEEREKMRSECEQMGINGDEDLCYQLKAFHLGAQNETILRWLHIQLSKGVIFEACLKRNTSSAYEWKSFRVVNHCNTEFFQGLVRLFNMETTDVSASKTARKTLLTGLTRFGIKPGGTREWMKAYNGEASACLNLQERAIVARPLQLGTT